MFKKNKKWFISVYAYMVVVGVWIITSAILFWNSALRQLSTDALYSMKSYYSAESGIEEWLLAYKKNPDTDNFVWEDKLLDEDSRRQIEYKDQNVYRKELIIEETIPAWKSIQFFFRKIDLDENITKIHIAFWQKDDNIPVITSDCYNPKLNASVEIWAYQNAEILTLDPLSYNVDLNSNWNWCYVTNNSAWKRSVVYYTDPYSNESLSYIWDKCILNSKWNVDGSVFEQDIPYIFNDRWNADPSDDFCSLDCWGWTCSNYYTQNFDVQETIPWYLKYYTIAPNIINSDFDDETLITLDIRAIDEDAFIMVWATDDAWNAYDIPWRYINFTATGVWSQWDIVEWVFTRLTVKKKANTDLLPIFDYALFSESELIK